MNWRDKMAPIIRKVIQDVGTEDVRLLRKRLREAYPFGERAMHPYKIWCSEIKKQLGERKIYAPKPKEQTIQTEMF